MEKSNEAHAIVARRVLSEILADYDRSEYSVRLWDGSYWHPPSWKEGHERSFTLVLNHPGTLRSMFERPSMLKLGEEFLSGSFDVEGDLVAACELGDHLLRLQLSLAKKTQLALHIRSLPKGPTPAEGRSRAVLSGRMGSRGRLRDAIAYHYDLPVDFWKLWLDSTLAYSCAYFTDENDSLDDAQANKLEYICRKLYLSEGERLLDLGCGWGGLVIFAARNYGVRATGITLSRRQAEYGSHLIQQLGLQKQCEIRHLDFRDYQCAEQYDKVVCVGAIEHVPGGGLEVFFEHAKKLLRPGGLFLNHGITSSVIENLPPGPSFVDAFVFPDNGVTTLWRHLKAAEAVGFEVRDVECLREHYVRTCSEWLRRIEENELRLTEQSNRSTQRLFRLYVAAQEFYFKTGANSIHQVLLARSESQPVRIPLTRASWYNSLGTHPLTVESRLPALLPPFSGAERPKLRR
jgi:cyclopropane-fatty-acyl-phospholipid synthase